MAMPNAEFLFQCSSPSLFGFDRDLHSHRSAEDDTGEMHHVTSSARLSDVHLASRKANEAALRRYQAASWLQTMVGPLELPVEPSEEELRLCLRNGLILCNLINKIHPGAVLKIVDNPAPSSPPPQGAALSAFQYFENVRNFLVAVQEMNLPSFEASDLEQGSLQMGSSAKVVDCILSLKAYHEWQLGGGQGLWKFAGPWKSPCAPKPAGKLGSGRSLDPLISKTTNQFRKRWAFSGFDGSKNLSGDLGSLFAQTGKFYGSDPSELLGNSTEWMQHLSQKFVDIFHTSTKNLQEVPMLGMPDSARDLDSIASESLLKLVMLALQDRQPEEVPMLVEFMLRKVMEEFERRLSCQEEQLKQTQVQASEMLPTGMNICSEHLNKIQALEMELKRVLAMDQQRARTLESQSYELNGLKNSLETTRFEFQNMDSAWKKEMEALELKLHGLVQAASQYHKVVVENRELYNQVQDLKGNIRVYCRVRPFLPGQNNNQSVVDFIGEKGSIMIANPTKQGKEQRKTFNFNKIFGPTVTQEEVFLDTQPLIRSVLDGYNVCIFAYGQTGSGKTYTMTGPNNPTPKDWGVNFRALHDLFQISQNRKDLMNYKVGVQMMEIYNEQVRDLLSTDGGNKRLEIRNNSQQNGLNVPDANMVHVESTEAVLELMALGHKNRAVGSTALNERSSRSHSVLTVHVKGTDLASGAVLRGCLHLVDLAGSERLDRSEAVGERLKEAQHINKSLSALGDVIAALAQKSAHIPYRNSKLTQLLQDSLGGQAKTLMFVHISPDDESYSETISTLKFAERVATVELGAAQSNKESGEVRDLKDQVAFLKEALAKKDGELERVQKELKSKSTEFAQEKPRVRPGISPSQNMLQKCTIGAMMQHGQAKRRQPLEEVRNSEVRHSPGSLSILAQKCIPIKSIDLSQQQPPHTPLTPAGMRDIVHSSQEEDSATKRRAEDDSGKLRASKLARQGSCSPDEEENEEGRDSTRRAIGFYSDLAASTVLSSSKTKIRCENSLDTDITSSLKTPQDRTRIGRNFNFTVETTPLSSKSAHGAGAALAAPSPSLSSFHADMKRDSRFAAEVSRLSFAGTPPAATPVSYFDERQVPKQARGSIDSSNGSNRDCSSISEDSAGHTGRGVFEEEEEHESSNILRSMHEMEEALRAVDVCSNRVAGNRRQGPQSKSSTSHKQPSSSLPKKKAGGAALTGQALARARRRYSLVGSNKDECSAAETNKGGMKAIPTFEAKLIGEGGPVERSSLPRQSVVGLAPALGGGIHSKSSKRWV